MCKLSQNFPTISKCPNYLKMSQLTQNIPTISKCPSTISIYSNYLKISHPGYSLFQNFPTCLQNQIFLKNNSLDKNKDCAEI